MFTARITLTHFSSSVLICVANSSGVLPTGSKPSATKRSFTSGYAMLLAISRLRCVMISPGVPAGKKTPNQLSNSMSG
jgi:hypothetical protein